MKDIERIFETAYSQGRNSLSEPEVYSILGFLGLKAPVHLVLRDVPAENEIPGMSAKFQGEKLVVKISSSKTLHKTESGGVKIAKNSPPELFNTITEMKSGFPDSEILLCEFVEHAVFSMGQELMLGARLDQAFGPVITLGIGGTDAEGLTSALKPGYSPSIQPLKLMGAAGWEDFLKSSWIWRYVSGEVRGGKRMAPDGEMILWLRAFSALLRRFSDTVDSRWAIEEIEVNPLAVAGGRFTALDGLLRFRPSRTETRTRPTARGVWSLLKPSSVAVAGVSEKKTNMGRIILNNVLAAGFDRSRTYILKDYPGEIDGVKCCAKASDFPETVDMFVVAVPSKDVPAVLKEAGSSGKVRGVVLISGGMGEKSGSESVKNEADSVIAEAKRVNPDFSLSGGNSLGIVSAPAKVNTLFIPPHKLAVPIGDNPLMAKTAFISQSGAFVVSALSRMPWLKPVYSVSVGNQQDVTVADYVERVAEDPEIKVILAYMEGFKPGDGVVLAETVARARRAGKTVVIYKAGRTPTGQKAVMGHTASIAGDFVVTRDVLGKAGALVAETFDDFSDMTLISCCLGGFNLKSGRTFFISNAGFETAGMADNVHPGRILSPPVPGTALSEKLKATLKEAGLDSIVDVRNPLDVTPMAGDEAIRLIIKEAVSSEEIDAVLVSMVPLTPSMHTLPPGRGHSEDFSKKSFLPESARLARELGKPMLFCVAAGPLYDAYVAFAQESGVPVFRSSDRAVRVLAGYLESRLGKK